MGVREDMTDVERSADRRRRRIDRIDLIARLAAIEFIRGVRVPLRLPFFLESLERRFLGHARRYGLIHCGQWYRKHGVRRDRGVREDRRGRHITCITLRMPLRHHNLIAWQRADDLFIVVPKLARESFPIVERYELSSSYVALRTPSPPISSKGMRGNTRGNDCSSGTFLGARWRRSVIAYMSREDLGVSATPRMRN